MSAERTETGPDGRTAQTGAAAWAAHEAALYAAWIQQRIDAARGISPEAVAERWLASRVNVFLRALAQEALRLDAAAYDSTRSRLCQWFADEEASFRSSGGPTDPLTQLSSATVNEVSNIACAMGLTEAGAFPAVVAQLPVTPLEGFLVPVPGAGGGHVVVVNESLPTYANLLAKAMAQLLPLRTEPAGAYLDFDDVAAMPAPTIADPGVSRFIELMWRTVHTRPADAALYMPDPSYEPLTARLRSAMETFVVARHLAHLYLDHLTGSQMLSVDVAGIALPTYVFSHDHEREADVLAMHFTVRARAADNWPTLTVWGVDVLMASLAMLDVMKRTEDAGASQPLNLSPGPRVQRRAHLRNAMLQLDDDEQTLRGHLGSLDAITDACWSNLWDFVSGAGTRS